jgi:DUF1365 family protein
LTNLNKVLLKTPLNKRPIDLLKQNLYDFDKFNFKLFKFRFVDNNPPSGTGTSLRVLAIYIVLGSRVKDGRYDSNE